MPGLDVEKYKLDICRITLKQNPAKYGLDPVDTVQEVIKMILVKNQGPHPFICPDETRVKGVRGKYTTYIWRVARSTICNMAKKVKFSPIAAQNQITKKQDGIDPLEVFASLQFENKNPDSTDIFNEAEEWIIAEYGLVYSRTCIMVGRMLRVGDTVEYIAEYMGIDKSKVLKSKHLYVKLCREWVESNGNQCFGQVKKVHTP